MKIRTHKDLRVWQEAMDLAMEIFTLSKRFPPDERFSLTDQIRRSARSTPANISEAWRKRRYEAAFVCKLNDAEGEAAETQTHLELAFRCGYLSEAQIKPLDDRYEALLAQLVNMANHPEQWTVGRREDIETMRRGDKGTSGKGDGADGATGRRGDRETRGPIVSKSQSLRVSGSQSPIVSKSQSLSLS